jgi:hypothetical protein
MCACKRKARILPYFLETKSNLKAHLANHGDMLFYRL